MEFTLVVLIVHARQLVAPVTDRTLGKYVTVGQGAAVSSVVLVRMRKPALMRELHALLPVVVLVVNPVLHAVQLPMVGSEMLLTNGWYVSAMHWAGLTAGGGLL